jgi:hypothetical protein
MNLEFLERKDFWAGLFLIATGAAAIVVARDYEFGTALRMGPGYFPSVLGGLLILFGLYIAAASLRDGEKLAGSWALRPLIILPLSLVVFGLVIDRLGFVPAMIALLIGSALASPQFRLLEMLIFSVLMTALCAVVFVWALGLPYPLFAGF